MEDLTFRPIARLTRKIKIAQKEIEEAIETISSIENKKMDPDATRIQMISVAALENALRVIEES